MKNKIVSNSSRIMQKCVFSFFILTTFCILTANSFPQPSILDSKNTNHQKVHGDDSLSDSIHQLDNKFDAMDNRINSINHNMEMLDTKVDQKFEILSSNENHMDHKLDSLESKVSRKIDDIQVKAEQTFTILSTKMDRPQGDSTWPMSSFWYWLLGLDVVLTVVCRLL